MSKLERLLNLTAALLDTTIPLTAEEIGRRVSGYPEDKAAFRRMFERDKSDLRNMGVPVMVDDNPEHDPPIDGYLINRDDYAGADVRLEPDELAALHLATNLVRLDGADEGLVKLGGGAVDGEGHVGRVPFDDILATLVGAAAGRKAVGFTYSGTPREVEPWRVSFAKGHWYLSGWDRLREDRRIFRVDRLHGPLTDAGDASHEITDPGNPAALRGWELGDTEPELVEVSIDSDHAAWARHVFGEVSPGEDGTVVARLQVRNREALRSAVLTFLDHAEIISPPAMRLDMITWLEAQL